MDLTLAVPLWVLPLVALVVAFFSSMVGISGAFLLMPFQMSILGLAGPSASATNLVYNLIAVPGAAWRYAREGRLWWRLALVITAFGIPGTWLGVWLRTHLVAEREVFQPFVGAVLGYLGWRLLRDQPDRSERASPDRPAFSVPAMGVAACLIGVVGAIYGIGGGSFMVPICVTYFRLPLLSVTGATLTATLLTSLSALVAYLGLPTPAGVVAQPDWILGGLFGLGGLCGATLGAHCQRWFSLPWLKRLLAAVLLGLAARYLIRW